MPSRRGRSLSTRATDQIGVVISDLGNPFYMQVIEELYTVLEDAGLRMAVLTDPSERAGADARLLDGSIDGAILTTTRLGSAIPRELVARGLPVVLLNRLVDGSASGRRRARAGFHPARSVHLRDRIRRPA